MNTLSLPVKIICGVLIAAIIGIILYETVFKSTQNQLNQWAGKQPLGKDGKPLGVANALGQVVDASGNVVATIDSAGNVLDAGGNLLSKLGINTSGGSGFGIPPSPVVTADTSIHDVSSQPSSTSKGIGNYYGGASGRTCYFNNATERGGNKTLQCVEGSDAAAIQSLITTGGTPMVVRQLSSVRREIGG